MVTQDSDFRWAVRPAGESRQSYDFDAVTEIELADLFGLASPQATGRLGDAGPHDRLRAISATTDAKQVPCDSTDPGKESEVGGSEQLDVVSTSRNDHEATDAQRACEVIEARSSNILNPGIEPKAGLGLPHSFVDESRPNVSVEQQASIRFDEESGRNRFDEPSVPSGCNQDDRDWPDHEPDLVPDGSWQALSDSVTPTGPDFDFEIPDLDSAAEPETSADLCPEIGTELRARQLAIEFLSSHDELNVATVDLIADIILHRRWASAQLKVNELLTRGYTVKAIHLAFLVSSDWRDASWLDEKFGENLHLPVWARTAAPSLTWVEAIRLVEFFGDDAEENAILEFADHERQVWRHSSELRKAFPAFKDYLLRYRLSDGFRSPTSGWITTLHPKDPRAFDGRRNPEHTAAWWFDEFPESMSARDCEARIFKGEELGSLAPESADDLEWLDFEWKEQRS